MTRRAMRLMAWACAVVACAAPATGRAQGAALARGLDLEGSNKLREAATAFREAYAAAGADNDARTSAILGLERVFAALGQVDSILPVIEPAIRMRPRDPILHTIRLRALHMLGREDDVRAAFDRWRAMAPDDASPYREYARQLLTAGRAAAADTVLRLAARTLRATRELALETAQTQASLGLWGQSAVSWREAVGRITYAEGAAAFSLQPAPPAARDSIRTVLSAPPATLPVRRLLSTLLVGWRLPNDAWQALAGLAPDDSSAAAWRDFAERAEDAEAWSAARDAWARVGERPKSADALLRGARAALSARDAAGALPLLDRARDSAETRTVAVLRIEALAGVGRAQDAAQLASAANAKLDPGDRARAASLIADAWVRAGDVGKARAALVASGEAPESAASGWLALYEGNLAQARTLLKRPTDTPSVDPALGMTALALLARTRVESAQAVGEAFLSAARGDSARAIERFERAATTLPEAASLLLATAARLRVARRDTTGAVAQWQAIMTAHAESPEAPEAELAWARVLLARGDRPLAAEKLEHLIVTYPRSALVPIARRELERTR